MKKEDIWDLVFKSTHKASGMRLVEFVFSKDYKRMKRAFNYFCKKHNLK